MPAFTSSNATVNILQESADRLIVQLLRYVSSANDESSVLKVNAETLLYRTQILIPASNSYGVVGFPGVPSCLIAGANSNNNATAYVLDTFANGALLVTEVTGNLVNGDIFTVSGQAFASTLGASFTLGSVETPQRLLDIESVAFTVSGENTKVALEWSGAYANSTIHYTTSFMVGEGSGYYGRNALQAEVTAPAAANSDGNIYVSTYDMPSGSMYNIILEIRKNTGFAQHNVY